MFIFDLTPLTCAAAKTSVAAAGAAAAAAAVVTRGEKTLESVVVGKQRGSDGPAAAVWPETQLDLLIEPHITPHALYYQTLPEEKKKNKLKG